jgi:hypothetical protein
MKAVFSLSARLSALVALYLTPTLSLFPAVAPADPRPLVSETQVDHWTSNWQKRLSLDEWHIHTEIVRIWDLKPNTLGNLRWNSATKTATIKVLNPADYDLPATEIPADIEYTVLHELIHLQLAALPRDSASRNVEERVVNRLAEALFALEKGSNYRSRAAVLKGGIKGKSAAEASRSIEP